jgi:hypothetical protein
VLVLDGELLLKRLVANNGVRQGSASSSSNICIVHLRCVKQCMLAAVFRAALRVKYVSTLICSCSARRCHACRVSWSRVRRFRFGVVTGV